MRNAIICALALLSVGSAPVWAQEPTRWGVITSFVPTWKVPKRMAEWVVLGGTEEDGSARVDIAGTEFRIGFVRGTETGGDWGVSFVRKQVGNRSMVAQSFPTTYFAPGPSRPFDIQSGFSYAFEDTTLTGVEYHRFRPVANIKNRLQIGLLYGAGVAQLRGQVRGIEFDGQGTRTVVRDVTNLFDDGDVGLFNVAGFTLKPVPLVKFQLAVSGNVAPGLKVRASGGFDFPGYEVASVSVIYLFGSQ